MTFKLFRFLPFVLLTGIGISMLVTKSDGLWLNDQTGDGWLYGLMVVPFAILLLARYFNYDLVSPAVLFSFFWALSIGVAQLPFYNVPSWSPTTWALVTVPPLCLTVGALIATGNSATNRAPIPIDVKEHDADRLANILIVLMGIGALTLLYSFKLIGAVPILSPTIDETRFSDAVHPFIQLVTRLVPMCTVFAVVAAILGKHRRALFVGIAAIGTILLIVQAARLHVVTPVAMVLTILYIARGMTGRRLVYGAVALVGLLMLSNIVFFQRTSQHPEFAFESYLYDVLETRSDLAVALTPTQIGLSSSVHTLARIVDSGALRRNNEPGLYSLHGVDRYFQAKDSEEVGRRIAGELWTGTYLADIYGDWDLLGASIWSFICGIIYGAVYRAAVRRRGLSTIFNFAYMSFWLVFFIYVNIFTYYIFWVVDMLIVWYIVRRVWGPASNETGVVSDQATITAGT